MDREEWKEIERKKEFLSQYKAAKREEKLLEEQIQQLKLDATCPQVKENGEGIKGSRRNTDLSDYYCRLEKLTEELNEEKIKAIKQYEKVRKTIKKIKNPDEKEVLTRYYIMKEKWDEIPRKIGWSRSKTFAIYDKALKNIKLPEDTNK